MRKFAASLFVVFLPLLLLETFFHVRNDVYKKVLLYNYEFKEWQQAAPRMNYWPDTLIMGSSIAKQDLNPKIIRSTLRNRGIKTQIGNVSVNGESVSNDYLLLKRILTTCIKCPKKIVYQITDISLRNTEVDAWKDSTLRNMLKLYFPDKEFDSLLAKSAKLDPYYKGYLFDIKTYSLFRTAFTKRRVLGLLTNTVYKKLGFIKEDIYEPNYSDHNLINDLNGFYAYKTVMDKKTRDNSFAHQKDVLKDFKTGGATELFFNELLKLAKRNNIKIYFVFSPENKLLLDTFPKEENTLMKFVKSYAQSYNVQIIDNRKYLSTENELFFDLKHLNAKGATIYSKHFGNDLAKSWN